MTASKGGYPKDLHDMKAELETVLRKMDRFNEWERGYYRSISSEKRLEQFSLLFDMVSHYPDEIIEKAQEEHLNSLIESQARLLSAGKSK